IRDRNVTGVQTCALPISGIVLNNILKWVDRAPESPNVLRAGRKAGTMMSPTQVFQDGAFVMSIGTPGSYGILQTTPQMLLNVLEIGRASCRDSTQAGLLE